MWIGWLVLIVVCSVVGFLVGSLGPVIDSGESRSKVYRSTRKDLAGVAGEGKELDLIRIEDALLGVGLKVVEIMVWDERVVLVCERRRGSKISK